MDILDDMGVSKLSAKEFFFFFFTSFLEMCRLAGNNEHSGIPFGKLM